MKKILQTAVLSISLSFLAGCSFHNPSVQNTQDSSGHTGISEQETELSEPPVQNSDEENSDTVTDETDSLSTKDESTEILAYIKDFDGKTLSYDAVEWVPVPSERASELGIAEEHADSGFYVHNEDTALEKLPVAEECSCSILNWTSSYEPLEVTAEEFASVIKEREGTEIPYYLSVQEQKIIRIQEQYIP